MSDPHAVGSSTGHLCILLCRTRTAPLACSKLPTTVATRPRTWCVLPARSSSLPRPLARLASFTSDYAYNIEKRANAHSPLMVCSLSLSICAKLGHDDVTSHPRNHTADKIVNNTAPAAPPMDPRFVSVGCEMWEWLFDPDALNNAVLRKVINHTHTFANLALPKCALTIFDSSLAHAQLRANTHQPVFLINGPSGSCSHGTPCHPRRWHLG